jgi:uncharacterized protein
MSRMAAASKLKTFLENSARPVGTLRYHELQGFLFTIASAPELIRPSEWMPIIFAEEEAGYASLEEAKEVIGELMALYNTVNTAVFEDTAALPPDCVFRDDILANFDDGAPVAQWSRGFLCGHQWLEELWDAYVPEGLDEQFGATLLALSFFSSEALAEAFRKETGPRGQTLRTMAETIRRLFPDAVAEYALLGRSISRVLAEESTQEPGRRQDVKVGRNAPCPCGSGLKYKKCCGAKKD